ncbi:hypothetical protein [Pseudofrankia saprophytica]|uniref:hypothetical protein n=1 Tax=Pseudofrankia saprophytica TaxID=298655 RepID=UPI00030839E2|nr:hypothetical protein [Pseudofrankia saprophytica]
MIGRRTNRDLPMIIWADRMRGAMADHEYTLRDFVMLKARWGVSIQALIMRGSHLGRDCCIVRSRGMPSRY